MAEKVAKPSPQWIAARKMANVKDALQIHFMESDYSRGRVVKVWSKALTIELEVVGEDFEVRVIGDPSEDQVRKLARADHMVDGIISARVSQELAARMAETGETHPFGTHYAKHHYKE